MNKEATLFEATAFGLKKSVNAISKVPKLYSWKQWCKHRRGAANTGHAALKRALDVEFGDTNFEQLYQRRGIALCLPAVIMSTQRSYVFKTPHILDKQRDNKYKIADACLATSAAPILLPMVGIPRPHDNKKIDVFVDGGLWANNPSLVGLIESLEMTQSGREIQIISVSTASPPSGKVIVDNLNPSLVSESGWKFGVGVLETSLDAQAAGTQNIVSMLIKSHLKAKVHIIRLAHDAPSNEQALYVGIDRSDWSTPILESMLRVNLSAIGRYE